MTAADAMDTLIAEWERLRATPRRRGDRCLLVSGWIWRSPSEAPRAKTRCGSIITAFRGRGVSRPELATCPKCRAALLGSVAFRDPWGQEQ